VMGTVCRMDRIMDVARTHGLRVVEDCAQACGGRFNGQLVGTFGDFGCFSISAYKIVGGGEGGLVLTRSERDADWVNGLVEGGGLWRPVRFDPPRYDGELIIGGNYRMSEMEACVDVVQLGKMETTVARFRRVKQAIVNRLQTFAEITPQLRYDPAGDVGYQLRFMADTVDLAVDLSAALNAEGIAAATRGGNDSPDWHIYHYMFPLRDYKGCGCYTGDAARTYAKGACPVADKLFESLVSISLNQWYTDHDCEKIATGINKVLNAYCRADPAGKRW